MKASGDHPTGKPTNKTVRPSREDRQKQVLDAAIRCVLRSGFHGASMGDIAREAGISVGGIYRHFENKEAIIAAIVARDIAELSSDIAASEDLPDDALLSLMVDDIGTLLARQYERTRSALALEIYAEAARNPKVEAIVCQSSVIERQLASRLAQRTLPPGASEAELNARADLLRMLVEGMRVHGLCWHDDDPAALIDALKPVMRLILTGKATA